MTEIFKPRANMTYERRYNCWICRDQNNNLVCDGGPSVIWYEGREWEFFTEDNGYHRLDGPATSDGEWYINNEIVTDEIYQFAKENNLDLDNLSDEDRVIIALRFG